MAVSATLGFTIVSRYMGGGLREARRDINSFTHDVNSSGTSMSHFQKKVLAATAAIAAFGPALLPIAAQLTAVTGALVTMAGTVGVAFGAYGLAVRNAVTVTKNLTQAGKELTASQKDFNKQSDAFMKAWAHFGSGSQDKILDGLARGFEGLARAIPKFEPLLKAILPEINKVLSAFNEWTKGDSLNNYVRIMSAAVVPMFRNLSAAARDFINVMGDGFRAFIPRANEMAASIRNGAAALREWSDGGGFQRFLKYVNDNKGPLDQFWRAFGDALKNIGSWMKSVAGSSLSLLTDTLRIIASLDPSAITALGQSLLFLKSPLLWLVVNCPPLRDIIVKLLGSLNAETVYAVVGAFVALKVAFMLMNTALLTTPLGWIITGLVALGVGIAVLATKTQFFQTVWEALKVAWSATVNFLKSVWDTVSGALVTAWNTTWNALKVAVDAVWGALKTAWSAVVNAFKAVWDTIGPPLQAAWSAVWGFIKDFANGVWISLQQIWGTVVAAFQILWNAVGPVLQAAWSVTWNTIRTAAEVVWNVLKMAWDALLTAFQTAWNLFSTTFQAAWNAVWPVIRTIAEGVWNAMKLAWSALWTALQTAWNTFVSIFQPLWSTAWNTLKSAAELVWNALKTAWSALWDAIKLAWETFVGILRGAWETFWNALKTTVTGIWDTIKDLWNAFINDGIHGVWQEASEKIKSAWEATWEFLKSTADKIWHGIGEVIERAVNGIIGIINGIIGAWNSIAGAVGLDSLKLDKIPTVRLNFAVGGVVGDVPHFSAGGTVNFSTGGGVLGGYAPGRDTVPAMLSKGEGVLVPEAVRGLGPNFVHWANSHYSNGRGGKRVAYPGYANGGTVAFGRDPQNKKGWDTNFFQGGGVVFPTPSGSAPGGSFRGPGLGSIGSGDGNEGNASDGVVGPGGVITGGQSDTGGNDTSSPHAPGSGGLTGVPVLDWVLGFIGRKAIEAAFSTFSGSLDSFGIAGNFGKMLAGGTKKLLLAMIEKLVKADEEAKAKYEAISVAGAKSVGAWRDLAIKAMQMGGLDPSQIDRFLALMAAESGGNPNSINNWDINAKNGIPSQGLMQIIPPNFTKYHVAGTSNNILDPLANMAAAAAYIKARYGGSVPGSPYALGTPGATAGPHLVGENGPELVNFNGGETVTPAPETASILGSGLASTTPSFGTPQGIEASLKNRSFEDVARASKVMAEVVKQSWTKVVTDSTTGWTTLTPVLGAAGNEYGVDIPTNIAKMSAANTAAWTDMNLQSTTQWALMRDGTMLEANTMLSETVPASTLTMQEASGTAWSTMAVDSEQQYATMDMKAFTPFQSTMNESVPASANTMQTQVSSEGYQMSENVQSAVATATPPLNNFIATMDTALAKSAQLAGASGGGGGGALNPYSSEAASLLGGKSGPKPGGTAWTFAAQHPENRTAKTDAILKSMGYQLTEDGSWVGPNFTSNRTAMKQYAKGTDNASKGLALVGEEGPELLNFAGGESVTPAPETASILSGAMTAPAMPAPAFASAMPDISGILSEAIANGGDAEGILAQLQAIQEAAAQMAQVVQKSWTTVSTAGTTAQATLDPVLTDVITQHGQAVPQAMGLMNQANTLTWTTMAAQTAAQWTAMKAGTYTQAQQAMMVDVPLWLTTMSTQNTAKWTEMGLQTATQWASMRDGSFAEANDHMSVKMPEWGTQMNEAVSEAWNLMGEATATAWEGMKEGTRGPTNWIIENSYNNGLARLWNEVAAVIFEDGAKELPSVATLAKGGPVHGPGSTTADRVPALLSRGEHVWTAKEVARAGGHHAVQSMRQGVMGRGVRGAHHGNCFALGGWLGSAGNVGGGMSLPEIGELKRGSLMEEAEPFLDAHDSGIKSALAGSPYRRMGGSAGGLSPSDWMRQYIEKDDELNKIGSGGPPWVPGVSDVRTTWGGVAVNQRTADMLNAAQGLGASFSAVQGSWSTGVAASAGTHAGGGVVDLVPASDGNVGALRAVGFAAWNRVGGAWAGNEHIHAVALGDPTVSPAAAAQVASYLAGGNGLADGGPDNFAGGIPSTDGMTAAGGGRNVDPADLEQNVVSFDRGGLLQPGYTMAFNGTGKPEPVGHNLVPRGAVGDVNFEIHVHGNADAQAVVDGLNEQVLPKLKKYLATGHGTN